MSRLSGINTTPTYRMVIPSTGKEVKFHPFKVKDEKILSIASETKDVIQMADSLKTVISNCIIDDIDVDSLATFDIEYMFIQLRAKSVGETSSVSAVCQECGEETKLNIDLTAVNVIKNEEHTNLIKVNDDVHVEVNYPAFETVAKLADTDDVNVDNVVELVADSIKTVVHGEEVINANDVSKEEKVQFLESLTTGQFGEFEKFFNTMPKLSHTLEYKCKNGHDNKIEMEGLTAFF